MTDLIGLILPPVIDAINVHVKDTRVRYLVSLVLCLVVATVTKYATGDLSFDNVDGLLGSAGLIFAQAETVYKLYWKDSKLRKKML